MRKPLAAVLFGLGVLFPAKAAASEGDHPRDHAQDDMIVVPGRDPGLRVTGAVLQIGELPETLTGSPSGTNAGQSTLSYWTQITASEQAKVQHVWYLDNRQVLARAFEVRPPATAFHSTQPIKKGRWKVQTVIHGPEATTQLNQATLWVVEEPCAKLLKKIELKKAEAKQLDTSIRKGEGELEALHEKRHKTEKDYNQCAREAREGRRNPHLCRKIQADVRKLKNQEAKLKGRIALMEKKHDALLKQIEQLQERYEDCTGVQGPSEGSPSSGGGRGSSAPEPDD